MVVSHQGSADCKMKDTAVDGSLLGSTIAPDGFVSGAFLQRRIEFHPARKAISTVGSNCGDIKIEKLNPNVSGSSQTMTGKDKLLVTNAGSLVNAIRSDVVEHREHLTDPEISFRITFRRIGAGLANLGNTCFLNSVLQCLTYTEPFAAYLQSGKHKSSCHTSGFCAMCALQNHVMSALQSSGKILSPSHLVKNLQCISRRFQRSRQEDAHEYMVNLLESMHKCCLPSGVPSESSSAYEKSLVHKIFGGSLRSQVNCTQCSYTSDKFDPFLDLSLEINKADTLQKALKHFTAFEELDGGDRQYQCQRCRKKVRALKRLSVHKAPYVLSIHLKRFGSHVPGQKINKRVSYEPVLNLKPFVSDPTDGNLAYTLYGVLVHDGWSTHSGHYYCYVRTSSGIWHSLNDNKVSQVSEKVVFAQEAYILFYIRNKNSMPKKTIETIAKKSNIANTSVNSGLKFFSSDSNKAAGKVPIDYTDLSVKATPTVSLLQSNERKELFHSQRLPSPEGSKSEYNNSKESGENHGVDLSTDSDSSSKENKCRMVVENLVISLSNSKKDMLPTNASAKLVFQNEGKDTAIGISQQNPCTARSDYVSKNHLDQKNPCTARSDYVSKNHLDQKDDIVLNKVTDDNSRAMETRNKVHVPTFSALKKPDKVKILNNDSKLINSFNKPHFTDPLKNNVLACMESSNSLSNETETKLKRKSKHSRKRNIFHGPKHQILASLCVRKKRRKSCMGEKNYSKFEEEAVSASVSPDQDISKTANVIKVQEKCHSNIKKEKSRGSKDGCIDNGQSVVRNTENDAVMVEMGSNQNSIQTDVRVVKKSGDVKMSNLTWGLGDSSVTKRNDRESLSSSCYQSAHEPAVSIGYVLDEWDEEYDRGKRKKVKKSSQISDNSNPFQIIAQQNVQEKQKNKKILNRGSGRQPFRI